MRKLLALGVTAILAIAFAIGATTAFAQGGGGGGGGGEKGEKGNACPPPTPGHPDTPPPGCGHERDDNGNGNGNGTNGDGAACTAAGHPPVEEFGPISGPLHDNIGDEFPEPLGGTIHYVLCGVANLGL